MRACVCLTSPSVDQEPGMVCLSCAACTVRASADVFLSVASAPRVSRRKPLRCVLTSPCRQVFTETQHMQTERRTGLRLQGSRGGMAWLSPASRFVFDPAVIDVTMPHRQLTPVCRVLTPPPLLITPGFRVAIPHHTTHGPAYPLRRVLIHQRETRRSVVPSTTTTTA